MHIDDLRVPETIHWFSEARACSADSIAPQRRSCANANLVKTELFRLFGESLSISASPGYFRMASDADHEANELESHLTRLDAF